MKRCPQCSFIYLDSDQFCDLDGTLLVVDHSSIETSVIDQPEKSTDKVPDIAATRPRELNWKRATMATAAGLVIGLAVLLGYQRLSRPTFKAHQISQAAEQNYHEASANVRATAQEPPLMASGQPVSADASPSRPAWRPREADPSPLARTDSGRLRLSSRPVSTGGVGKAGRGPVIIRLTDGSSLHADEAWRTKAGIWYRSKGMVTFLKPSRVKAMENQAPPR